MYTYIYIYLYPYLYLYIQTVYICIWCSIIHLLGKPKAWLQPLAWLCQTSLDVSGATCPLPCSLVQKASAFDWKLLQDLSLQRQYHLCAFCSGSPHCFPKDPGKLEKVTCHAWLSSWHVAEGPQVLRCALHHRGTEREADGSSMLKLSKTVIASNCQ